MLVSSFSVDNISAVRVSSSTIEVIRASNQVVGCRILQVVSRARFAGFTGYLGSIEKGFILVFGFVDVKEQQWFDRIKGLLVF